MPSVQEILWDARERLGVHPDDVERRLGLDSGKLARLEAGEDELESALLDRICEFYGLNPADVAAETLDLQALEPIRVLLRASSPDLSSVARLKIARVAAAMGELRSLEEELGLGDRYRDLRERFRHEGVYGEAGAEWKEGRDLALRLRDDLGLGHEDPIASLRDVVSGLGIELLAIDLGDPLISGFSLADSTHGPSIIVSMRGPNANPWVRRFTIAHELCHVLHDEKVHRDVAPVQLYSDGDDREQDGVGPEPRANAFAAYFLAPDEGVRAALQRLPNHRSLADEVCCLMETFGINFKTASRRLIHAWGATREDVLGLQRVRTSPRDKAWFAREALWDWEFFPCPSIPEERRGSLTRIIAKAWRDGDLDRGQAVALLHAAPDETLEELPVEDG